MKSSTSLSTLRAQLFRTFEDPTYRPPPLPNVVLELSALVADKDATLEQVVRLLERDQMLAGAVMRLVGSPIYAGRGAVRSLSDAVMRLGMRTVQNSVFEIALKKSVFGKGVYDDVMQRIAHHSLVSAHLTRVICRHARVAGDQAFLGALLHDVGFAALLLALVRKNDRPPPLLELWPDIDKMHEEASKAVTKLWGLPNELSLLVAHHHQEHTGTSVRIAAVMTLADYLSARFDADIQGPVGLDGARLPACTIAPASVEDGCTLLGLGPERLDRIVAEAEPVVREILKD